MRTKPLLNFTQETDVDFYTERKMNSVYYTADFWEMIVPTVGVTEVSVDGKRRSIQRGTIVIYAPEDKRRICVKLDGGEYIAIRFSPEAAERIINTVDPASLEVFKNLHFHVRQVSEEHILSILRAVEKMHIAEEEERESAAKVLAYTVLLPLFPFHTYDRCKEISERALYIMNDPQNIYMRLPDVAEQVGVSEEYLVRCFKKDGLDTPNTIFKRIKMRYAKSVLTTQKAAVTEVATKVGFRSVGHFNKLYVSEYGVCPGLDKTR